MESPFFRSHWNYPQNPRYVPSRMGVPVQRPVKTVGPKVVSIPVRFVASEKSRLDSIAEIQKVVRGFLVRRSVKKIMAIKREIDEIELRLVNEEIIKLIRKDAKERLKFGEILMNLLLKLDSVKGVDSGVRDLRKAVIKKAIALQEKIDSITACDESICVVNEAQEIGNSECGSEAVVRCLEMGEDIQELNDGIPNHERGCSTAVLADKCDPLEAQHEISDGERMAIESADDCKEHENTESVASGHCHVENQGTHLEKDELPDAETATELKLPEEVDDNDMEKEEAAETSEAESQTDSSANPPILAEDVENVDVEERMGGGNEENCVEEEPSGMNGEVDEKRSRMLLERMMVDNKKMMEMMGQLFERNEIQTRLLNSLSQRVGLLEKAFVCEALRRKKKRNGSTVDCSEKNPKTNRQ